MLARSPRRPITKAEAKLRPRQLNRDKRRHLIGTVAGLMKAAKESGTAATLLNFEGPCRHGLRSRLTLEGWRWQDADDMATEIVAAALRQIGAQRPTWAEGQPEYVQNGAGALIERTRCIRCHGPLPEGHFKFCDRLCGQSHREIIVHRQTLAENRVIDTVVNPRRYSQWF